MSESYFGRSWKLQITPGSGAVWTVSNSVWDKDNEALKCTFEIEQAANSSWWVADIGIFNFDPEAARVIRKDDAVAVTAGYDKPGSGLIFSGHVFQPLWERIGAYDNKLTLHCLFGMWEDENSYVTQTIAAGASQADFVAQIAKAGRLEVANLDPVLSTKKYIRGQSFAGIARRFFDQIALDNHLRCWIGPEGLYIRSLVSTATVPDIVYAPPFSSTKGTTSTGGVTKYTLIGTPQQTEMGICFRTLLDSEVRLGSLLKLTGVVTRRLPQQPMQWQAPYSDDALYTVAGIRHCGDTRGNDWYTEISGVFPNWDSMRMQLFTH